jgi:hypothetical protein
VYVSYTPGYLGTEVSPDHVVVYGTGWDYSPYIGDEWIGGPCTYGFGAGFADSWELGFGFGFGAGEWLGTWGHPWWGPYDWGWRHHYDYDHVSLNHVDMYHHWKPGVVHGEHDYRANAWNGRAWSHDWGTHFNPYSSHADNHPRDRRTGAYHGNFPAPVPRSPAAPHPSGQHDLYSGRDGSIYRRNPSGTWEQHTGQSWQHAPAAPRANLEQHALSRNLGQQRFNNFRSFGGGFSHSGGGHVGGGGHAGGGHAGGGSHR